MAVNRRTLWLLLVMVVLLVVAVFVWSGGPGPPSGTPTAQRPGSGEPRGRGGDNQQPPRVQLDALQVQRTAPRDAERNPFQFEANAPSGPASGFVPQEPVNEAALSPTLPQMPTGPPPPPPIPLKFIGVVEQNGKRVAVLSDGRSTPYGTEGAIILGQYRILKIGTESIEMAYVDGRGRQTIRLTGQ
jgi:hypothetical protein